jgi:hypothetical protein
MGALPSEDLAPLAKDAVESFATLLKAVDCRMAAERSGVPAHLHHLCRMPIQCAEMVERDGGRFDCRYGLDALGTLLDGQGAAVSLLLALLGTVLGPELAVLAHGQVVALAREGRERHLCSEGKAHRR